MIFNERAQISCRIKLVTLFQWLKYNFYREIDLSECIHQQGGGNVQNYPSTAKDYTETTGLER